MSIQKHQTLFDIAESLATVAQIATYRTIAHSTMIRCIGSIRQNIRNRQYKQRNEKNATFVDDRNDKDEQQLTNEPLEPLVGLGTSQLHLIKEASIFHAVYDWAISQLQARTQSPFDQAMTPENMLHYIIRRAMPTDQHFLEVVAEITGVSIETTEQFQEMEVKREQEQVAEQAPEILATFHGFSENGHKDSDKDLNLIDQHQLGVKIVERLLEEQRRMMSRALRARRMDLLGNIPKLKTAVEEYREWVLAFEHTNKTEISEALNAGRNLRVLNELA